MVLLQKSKLFLVMKGRKESMFCQNCGAQFNANFCPNCGTPANREGNSERTKLEQTTDEKSKKPITKKWWFWLLIVFSCIVLISSFVQNDVSISKAAENSASVNHNESSTDNNTKPATQINASNTKAPIPTEEPISIPETSLFDQDGIKVTATSLTIDDWMGPEVNVLIENNTTQPITVQVREVSMNGAMVSSVFSCDVAAGKKANDSISFIKNELENIGINTIQQIEFRLHIFQSESWDDLFDSETIVLNTNAPSDYKQVFDINGFTACEQDGITFIVLGMGENDDIWGQDMLVFIRNDSERAVTIQVRDVSVNGFMIDPIFSCDVSPGKAAYSSMTFDTDSLKQNGIQEFEEVEFSVHVFDLESWDTLFDSESITVKLPL